LSLAAAGSLGRRIACYKVARCVVFVNSFPMTVTGRILDFRLREQVTTSRDQP
jgi:acyl-CoA synthetase (AMP-forming)/AMP-acid ligase II